MTRAPKLMDQIPTVFIYNRASYDPKETLQSCECQEEFNLNYLATDPWCVAKGLTPGPDATWLGEHFKAVIHEPDVSATMALNRRPKGGIMCKLLKPGDHVVVTRGDRLFRRVGEFFEYWEKWGKAGITIHTSVEFKGPVIAENAAAWLFIAMRAVFSEYENRLKSDRVKEVLHMKMRRGDVVSRYTRLGTKFVQIGPGHWEVVESPEEIALMKQMLAWHQSGHSAPYIRAWLRKCGCYRQELVGKKGALRDRHKRVHPQNKELRKIEWSPLAVYKAIQLARKWQREEAEATHAQQVEAGKQAQQAAAQQIIEQQQTGVG